VLRHAGKTFIQSGNIRNPHARPGEWIIDETVEAIHQRVVEIVRTDSRFARHREALGNGDLMAAAQAQRTRYFLPVRPLDYYLNALKKAGFSIPEVSSATIEAKVEEWYQFLIVYHEGVLPWVDNVPDRRLLMREAMGRLFGGKDSFSCCWTYLVCGKEDRG
jgi:hypothetical protein